jgi:hypothetical protein
VAGAVEQLRRLLDGLNAADELLERLEQAGELLRANEGAQVLQFDRGYNWVYMWVCKQQFDRVPGSVHRLVSMLGL